MKSKLVKRGLALILTVAMVLTSNAFSTELRLVKAAEADEIAEGMEGYADETESPVSVDDENAAGGGSAEDVDAGTDDGINNEGDANTETDDGNSDTDDENTETDNGNSDGNTDTDDGNSDADDENADTDDGNTVDEEGEASEGETGEGEADESLEVSVPSYNNAETQTYYRGVAFQDETAFNSVREDMELLWGNKDTVSVYADKWHEAATIEALLQELLQELSAGSETVQYAYIEQTNPNITNKTITIPNSIKGVIIGNGWYDGEGGNEGYNFGIVADTLDIKGTGTAVYFSLGSKIETKSAKTFTVKFPSAENTSKVTFRDINVKGTIKCDSTVGTIAFEGETRLTGYANSSLTEFHKVAFVNEENEDDYMDAVLLIANASAGLVFDEIAGDTTATIVYNGYPDNLDFLPRFNKEIDLGKNRDNPDDDNGIGIRFMERSDNPFKGDWWGSPDQRFETGTQMAYYAGDTWNERERIGCRVYYSWNLNDGEDEEEIGKFYIDSRTGRLQKDGEDGEESAYEVLVLTDEEFSAVKADTQLLWKEDGDYNDRWDGTDTLDSFRADKEYVAIQARKSSYDNERNKILALPASIKGALLVSGYDWDEDAQDYVRVSWQLNSLTASGETEVVIDNVTIDPEDQELNITTGASANVTFRDSEVQGAVKTESTAGTIAFEGNNILNGYESRSLTKFLKISGKDINVNLLIANASAGLVFNEIEGDTDVSIIYNGYPDNLDFLPRFNKAFDLGKGVYQGEEYPREISIRFWDYPENQEPFGLDGTDGDWWQKVDAVELEKGIQIAYFAGDTWNERKSIGRRVNYYAHTGNDGLNMNQSTGRLEKDGEDREESAYRVLVFNNAKEFGDVKADTGLLWDESYDKSWDGVDIDTLSSFLGGDSVEYLAIQAKTGSYDNEDKTLVLPANIKGALLVSDGYWDADAEEDVIVPWQLNSLTTSGAAEVVICNVTIDPQGQDLNITTVDGAKVTFRDSEVQGVVKSESLKGTIAFEGDTILNGYENSSLTEFPKFMGKDENNQPIERDAKLLITNASAGLVFNKIEGDTDVNIVYNGYPVDPDNLDSFELLPYFNEEISLGEGKYEGVDYDRNVRIRFLEYSETPFEDDWWDTLDVELDTGTQIAYFAGDTWNERASIGCRVMCDVNYSVNGEDVDLHMNPSTGRLEKDGEDGEQSAYRVFLFNDAEEFEDLMADTEGLLWDESYADRWDGVDIDTLNSFLGRASVEYLAIQATKESHANEDKTLELPANIKEAWLVSDYDENGRVPWLLNSLTTSGETFVVIDDEMIDPEGQKLNITAKAANAEIVFVNSEIGGDVSISENTTVRFSEAYISGSINSLSNIEITGTFYANGLTGCPKLTVLNRATFIVRNPEVLIFNDIEIKSTDGGGSFDIVYNGYPDDAAKLPVFKGDITCPVFGGASIRFIQRGVDKNFWEVNDWWDTAQDEILTAGKLVAHSDMSKADTENLLKKVSYATLNTEYSETTKLIAIVDGDGKSKIVIAEQLPGGKTKVVFDLKNKDKTYDGAEFSMENEGIFNYADYDGDMEFAWKTADGIDLDAAPKDVGEYIVEVSVPENTDEFAGSTPIPVRISPKTVTVSVRPEATETPRAHVKYDIVWDGFIGDDTFDTQAEVVESEEQTDDEGTYYTLVTTGGAVGTNYVIRHADPVRIKITGGNTSDDKPCITKVLFPKKKTTFSAVYTGEQIRPVMSVACEYKDEKGRAKTQSLKLNVDYTVTYSNNVNVTNDTSTAKVTVKGIGEYAGEITKEFSITPKSIKKVTLSAVGDIVYGDEPTVVVMDGIYELVEGEDYTIKLSAEGSATADTVSELTVDGIGNYKESSKKKVKFNILKSDTEIKSIADVTVEFKKLPTKGYTYNGKAQKPAVVVKDGGTKVPSSQYKVIYTNNVNAGKDTATVQVVGVSKRGKGYYGIAKQQLTFEIKQKDFGKVSVSSVAAIPKTENPEDITITVKDGKRILTENEDYTIDYKNIRKPDGSIQDNIKIGTKYEVTLNPVEGGNYTKDSKKIIKVKFGQLNLASKTAKYDVEITDAAKGEVEVKYNGLSLKQGTDYTATVKKEKNKPTYTVTIKAVKGSSYKGKKTIKGVAVEVKEEEEE